MSSLNDTGVGDLLEALGRECATLASISEKIQTILVCAGVSRTTGPSFYSDAQSCDLLTQSLIAIAELLSVISQRIPRAWTLDIVDVLQELPLSALAAALALEPKPNAGESSGAIELFQ